MSLDRVPYVDAVSKAVLLEVDMRDPTRWEFGVHAHLVGDSIEKLVGYPGRKDILNKNRHDGCPFEVVWLIMTAEGLVCTAEAGAPRALRYRPFVPLNAGTGAHRMFRPQALFTLDGRARVGGEDAVADCYLSGDRAYGPHPTVRFSTLLGRRSAQDPGLSLIWRCLMTTTISTVTVLTEPMFSDAERLALAGYLASYSELTRESCALDLRLVHDVVRSKTSDSSEAPSRH